MYRKCLMSCSLPNCPYPRAVWIFLVADVLSHLPQFTETPPDLIGDLSLFSLYLCVHRVSPPVSLLARASGIDHIFQSFSGKRTASAHHGPQPAHGGPHRSVGAANGYVGGATGHQRLTGQPVFTSMLKNAVRICDAKFGSIYRWTDGALHIVATYNSPTIYAEARRRLAIIIEPGDPMDRVIGDEELCSLG